MDQSKTFPTPPAQVLQATMAQLPRIHLWLRRDGSVAFANAEGSSWWQAHAGDNGIHGVFAGLREKRWAALFQAVHEANRSRVLTVRALATGHYYDMQLTPIATRHECLHVLLTDINRRRAALDRLRESHEFYQAIINAIGDPVFVKDPEHRCLLVNDECCRMLGRPRELLVGKDDAELFGVEQANALAAIDDAVLATGEADVSTVEYKAGSGEKIAMTTKKSRYLDPLGRAFIVGVSRDVTVQRRVERKLQRTLERLAEQSLTDELTRLYNRRGFITFAEQQLKLAERHGFVLCLLFADLNELKHINDHYGHPEGDEAIRIAARVIAQSLRKSDLVGRIGGDEFVILAAAANEADGAILREHIYRDLAASDATSGKPYRVRLAIGVAVYRPGGQADIHRLLHDADQAMYAEKARLKGEAR